MRKYFLFILFFFYAMGMAQDGKQSILHFIEVKDDKIIWVFEDCIKRAPKKIKIFDVTISLKDDYSIISIDGIKDSDEIGDFGYLGYTEIDGCTLYIVGDCYDCVKYFNKKKHVSLVALEEVMCEGGTPYSWTYIIRDDKIYYMGNWDQE